VNSLIDTLFLPTPPLPQARKQQKRPALSR